MSKKNVFISNNKEITIAKGKIDLSNASPEFKEKVQLFADGINTMNNEMLHYNDKVNTERHALELYLTERFQDGSVVEQKQETIKKYEEARDAIRAEINAKMPEFDKVDKNLYYAYRQYTNKEVEYDVYVRAFAEWIDNAGVTPTNKGIDLIVSKIGVNKASAKTMCKNGGTVFTNAKGEKQFLDLVYRVVANLMYDKQILTPFTYTYVIPEKTNKKNA